MGSAAQILSILSNALGFSNLSTAAANKMVSQGIGDFIDNILQEFTNTQNEILNIINTQRFGRSNYYTGVALAFQDGDDLVPAQGTLDPTYAVIDPTKQVVKQAAFQNSSGSLSLKIAALNAVTGQLQALTTQQLADFTAYFVNFEIPGIPVSIVSLPPNIFSFTAVCTFNAGYNLSNLQSAIQAALVTFNNTFPFNGILYTDKLSNYIQQNVPGVIDFFVSNMQIDGVAFAGATILTAGYFNYPGNITSAITYNPTNG